MFTMMFLSFLPVLLLPVTCSPVDGAAAQPRTFRYKDPNTGYELECDRCPPGTFLRSRCTATQKSDCVACPVGSFTELWNHVSRCLRCGVCGLNQATKSACTADRDCQCVCKQGYFSNDGMCMRHSECASGEGVQSAGTPTVDTVCQVCPNGTYSDVKSALQSCMQHRSCEAAGLHLVVKGSSWHDSVCTSSVELQSKDGAEYLREILPAFFIHQRISIRVLRHTVAKLLSDNGKKQGEAVLGLKVSDLHRHINTWVASATVKQLQDLPTLLIETGANCAGEKLAKKLQHINSHLKWLRVSENEV